MAIQKKSLVGATSKPRASCADTAKKPEVRPEQAAKSATVKKLTVAKLATAKLSTARLVALRRIH
jgi:hypothetical protein